MFPPRPTKLLRADQLNSFEHDGYILQPKVFGSCVVISAGKVYDRFGQVKPIQVNTRPMPHDSVIVGMYTDSGRKCEGGEDFQQKLVLWDILSLRGRSLQGSMLRDRISLLWNLFPGEPAVVGGTPVQHLSRCNDDIWLVNSQVEKFLSIYHEIAETDLYEGVVIKRLDSKLEACNQELNNYSWQAKVRKPTLK